MAKKVLGFVVIVGIVVFLRMRSAGKDDAQVQEEMHAALKALPCYQDCGDYIDSVFKQHHGASFDQAYDIGGRRRRATFDEDKYVELLFGRMIASARDAGKTNAVDCLQLGRAMLTSPGS